MLCIIEYDLFNEAVNIFAFHQTTVFFHLLCVNIPYISSIFLKNVPHNEKSFLEGVTVTPVCLLRPSESQSDEWELPHLACSVYYNTVQDLPAMVRLWWNSQEKRVSATVEKFTTKYVSPVLAAQEISSVHGSPHIFENMTVSN